MALKRQFEVTCVLGKQISVTEAYWLKIIRFKHPALAGKEAQVQETLTDADEVRESKSDPTVWLYYLFGSTTALSAPLITVWLPSI